MIVRQTLILQTEILKTTQSDNQRFMMRKLFFALIIVTASAGVSAQNVQLHYDFGSLLYSDLDSDHANRSPYTSTVEMFHPDDFGSTFFFVDMDYNDGVSGAYWEISRELCFWKGSSLEWLSAHFEYNGGLSTAVGSFNNAYLLGATCSGHNNDFSATWSVSAMYKNIPHTKDRDGNNQTHNYQLTGVWNISLLDNWMLFSGFIDFWSEPRPWQNTTHILLAEPQIWLNLNKISRMEKVNLSVGSEVELSNNFVSKGFYAVPTLAAKWTF